MVKSDVHVRKTSTSTDNPIKYNYTDDDDHQNTSNQLEWDDTNWKIDEYTINQSNVTISYNNHSTLQESTIININQLDIDTTSMDQSEFVEPTTNTEIPGDCQLTDLSNFSDVDFGRLQSESFRNKSVNIKSSKSFTNKIPYFLPPGKKT